MTSHVSRKMKEPTRRCLIPRPPSRKGTRKSITASMMSLSGEIPIVSPHLADGLKVRLEVLGCLPQNLLESRRRSQSLELVADSLTTTSKRLMTPYKAEVIKPWTRNRLKPRG
jgi:hypothetical protein